MKLLKLKSSIFYCSILFISEIYGQETINTSGNEASGSGGSVNYSIGQLFFNNVLGSNGSEGQGVQHSIELITLNLEEDLLLIASAKVYPNPTSNKIHLRLELDNFENLSYQLFDVNGRLLQDKKINETSIEIELSQLTSATYFLKIIRNKDQLKTFRILKN